MTLEQLFEKSAKRNMIQFSLKEFKKTHPKLMKSIEEALIESFNHGINTGANLVGTESLKSVIENQARKN